METQEILDTSIAIERPEGTITLFTAIEYPPSLKKSFDVIIPEIEDYIKAIEIADKLRSIGKPIGAIDIIIAAMCLNRSLKLITKDGDFKSVKSVFPELVLEVVESER